jgi:transposase
MPDPELPRLSGAELMTHFGGDEAALRRYRMLVALLREGRSAGEVARTFGVSRESLRRLRIAFRRDGLAALRSRKRGGGHLARGSPLARAITQELQHDPGISAAMLWRRVQALMREDGYAAPRSTFYRLLSGLRDEESDVAAAGIPPRIMREALGALAEDPPLALGRSALADWLLPDEADAARRGRRLKEALQAAIARLRPSEAGPILDDPRWRHYLIIAGEYLTGEERAALIAALALSSSTYSRAKREALERMAALLPIVLRELPPPAPPASLIAPPPPRNEFDREAELEVYIQVLRRDGLALIWGPSGVGKVELAATIVNLLHARGQRIVWHTCRSPDNDRDATINLLLALATALALDSRHELWNALHSFEPTDLNRQLALLEGALEGRHWLVVVANSHWLVGTGAAQVMDVLAAAQQRRDIRLMLVGRTLPNWANEERWPPLPFPSDSSARQEFLTRLSGMPFSADGQPLARAADALDLGAVRERANYLLAAIAAARAKALPPEQAAVLLEVLQPIEEAIVRLHSITADDRR